MPQRKLTKEPFFQNSKTIMGHIPNFQFTRTASKTSTVQQCKLSCLEALPMHQNIIGGIGILS